MTSSASGPPLPQGLMNQGHKFTAHWDPSLRQLLPAFPAYCVNSL